MAHRACAIALAAMCGVAVAQVPTPAPLPGLLRPITSETRQILDLSGVWQFRNEAYPGQAQVENWVASPLQHAIPMPVPASYNDITTNSTLRDFVGVVAYETTFFVPFGFAGQRVHLWFGSADYSATVFLNGNTLMSHDGGHLPFEADITDRIYPGVQYRLTALVNNTLTPTTLPPGTTSKNTAGRTILNTQMDFFPYAGLHRPVYVYSVPSAVSVTDLTTATTLAGTTAYFRVDVEAPGGSDVAVSLTDADGNVVASNSSTLPYPAGTATVWLTIPNAKLWWPYLMSDTPAYLHTLTVNASAATCGTGPCNDVYRMKVGLRTVAIGGNSQLLINGAKAYLTGFGKHEDADWRGKGMDQVVITRDHYMLTRYFGANSYRSSHYPYSEQILDACDSFGIMLVNEAPAVGLQAQNMALNATLEHHLMVESEHIRRDKNRASTIIWSVANEPASAAPVASSYFQQVISHVKALDPTRPVLFDSCQDWTNDVAVKYNDLIGINKYYGWYIQTGELDTIPVDLPAEIQGWRNTFNKPVLILEYGADTVPGLHDATDSPFVFTEDYQRAFYEAHWGVFDTLRTQPNPWFVGEMTWCFADFATGQSDVRVQGNKKGVLTRAREPKAVAGLLAARYKSIAAAAPVCPLSLADLSAKGCTSALGLHVTPALPPAAPGPLPAQLHQSELAVTRQLRGISGDALPAAPAPAASADDGRPEAAVQQLAVEPAALHARLAPRLRQLATAGSLSAEEVSALLDALETHTDL